MRQRIPNINHWRGSGICEKVEAAGATPTHHTHSVTAFVYHSDCGAGFPESFYSPQHGELVGAEDWLYSVWNRRAPGHTMGDLNLNLLCVLPSPPLLSFHLGGREDATCENTENTVTHSKDAPTAHAKATGNAINASNHGACLASDFSFHVYG